MSSPADAADLGHRHSTSIFLIDRSHWWVIGQPRKARCLSCEAVLPLSPILVLATMLGVVCMYMRLEVYSALPSWRHMVAVRDKPWRYSYSPIHHPIPPCPLGFMNFLHFPSIRPCERGSSWQVTLEADKMTRGNARSHSHKHAKLGMSGDRTSLGTWIDLIDHAPSSALGSSLIGLWKWGIPLGQELEAGCSLILYWSGVQAERWH